MEEEDEQKIKQAFSRVKEEISSLQMQITSLASEIADLKMTIIEFSKTNGYKTPYNTRNNKSGRYNGLSRKF